MTDEASRLIETLGLDHQFIEMTKSYMARFSTFRPGPKRAKHIQGVADAHLQRDIYTNPEMGPKLSCGKGCAHCCYIMVAVTDDEADLLAERVKREGMSIDMPRLRAQAELKNDNAQEYINKISYQDRKCVFLGDDNHCRVYSDRPVTCRSYLVVSHPDGCRTENGTMNAQSVLSKDQFAIQAAAAMIMGSEEGTGQLAKKMLERL